MARTCDADKVRQAALDWQRQLSRARLSGMTREGIRTLEARRDNSLAALAGKLCGQQMADALAAKQRVEEAYRTRATAQHGRDLALERDQCAAATDDQLKDAIAAAMADPLAADYDRLAIVGAECRRRSLNAEANTVGTLLEQPQHVHDHDWQVADADQRYYARLAAQAGDRPAHAFELPTSSGPVRLGAIVGDAQQIVDVETHLLRRELTRAELPAR